jgi:copper transport protein
MDTLSAQFRRGLGLIGAFCAVGVAFASFGAQPALAHNGLAKSVPASGAVVTTALTTWSLTFTGDVPLDTTSAEIVAADGVRTKLPAPTRGVTNKEVLFKLPPDLTGAVTARWRLVGTDGHVITERVSFTVNLPTAAATPNAAVTPDAPADTPTDAFLTDTATTPEPVRLAVRSFGYAALLLVGGMMIVELFIARGVMSAFRARETLLASGAVLAIVPLLQLLIFLDDSRDFGVLGSVFHIFEAFDTTAGSMYIVRFLTAGVLFGGILHAGKALVSMPMLAASGVYLVTLVYTGHSRSMVWPLLGVPAGVIHTVATVVWLGGLIVFIFFVIPHMQPAESFEAFRRFGTVAQYAVIAMVVTGIIQTLRLHGDITTLFTQNHGRWLVLKLILVASMLKIGDINRRRLLRKLPTDEAAFAGRVALLRRASVTEIINGALVMLVTAIFVSASFN